MTREEAKEFIVCSVRSDVDIALVADAIKALEQDLNMEQFAKWVATEIFDEDWKYNKHVFAEIACRKLAELGIVRKNGDTWELVKLQGSEETATQNASTLKKTYEKEDYYDALETAYEKGHYDALVEVRNKEW